MAKRMKSKIQPAVQTFVFTGRAIESDEDKTHFIDLSQCASLMNRRFYRQGLNWAVGSIKIRTRTAGLPVHCEIQVQKLPNTWVMSNAWEKGFRHWMKMNKEALETSQSVKPKFLDFKIYANDSHHVAGFAQNLLPIDAAGNEAIPGEWVHSTFHIPNTAVDSSDPTSNNPRSVIAVGANYQSVGADTNYAVSLIEGYAASRALPDTLDPNTPDDADSVNGSLAQNWLAALDNDFDQQTGEVLNDMITENNKAPYPFEGDGTALDTMYPGGANNLSALQIHDEMSLTGTTIGGVVHMQGGNFPCGLMGFRFNNFLVFNPDTGEPYDQEIFWDIQVDLVPGAHRGYLAESMTEM